MKNTRLKKILRNKEQSIGSWITIPNQSVIDILAEAGFDWLTVDMEHTSIDYNELQILIGFIQAHGMAALVRVSKNEEVSIKRALDAGADGIIVPMVKNKKDMEMAVDFAKYPPVGKRGVGLNRAQRYGYGFEEYKNWVQDDLVIIAQIEHIDAINNLEEIANSEHLDGMIVGPYDLSGSLGIPGQYNEPIVIEALEKLITFCEKNKKSLGFHVIDPDMEKVKRKIEEGFNFIAFSTDFLFMGRKATEEMNKLLV